MEKITLDEINAFLQDLSEKIKVFDIVFEDREKNRKALTDLEITHKQRIEFIKNMKPQDYISGPNKDTNDTSRPDYWVFGIKVKEQDVYVKVNLGYANKRVVCISFHIAEYPLEFPFK